MTVDIKSVPAAMDMQHDLQRHRMVQRVDVTGNIAQEQHRSWHVTFRSFEHMVRVQLYASGRRIDFDVTPKSGIKPLVLEEQFKLDLHPASAATPVPTVRSEPVTSPPAVTTPLHGTFEASVRTIEQFIDLMNGLDMTIAILDGGIHIRYQNLGEVEAALASLQSMGCEVQLEQQDGLTRLHIIKTYRKGPSP